MVFTHSKKVKMKLILQDENLRKSLTAVTGEFLSPDDADIVLHIIKPHADVILDGFTLDQENKPVFGEIAQEAFTILAQNQAVLDANVQIVINGYKGDSYEELFSTYIEAGTAK